MIELLGHLVSTSAREPLDFATGLLVAFTLALVVAIFAFLAVYPEDEP